MDIAKTFMNKKVCQLYNILCGHSYFPQDIFVYSCHYYSTRSHHMVLSRPLAHTNSFLHSFVPNFISLWNSLSAEQVSAPSLHAFKRLVCLLLEKKKLPGKLRASAGLRGAIQFLSGS